MKQEAQLSKLVQRLGSSHIRNRLLVKLLYYTGIRAIKKNVNLSTIKELMGHENIQTTMIYAGSNEKSMIQAVKV